MATIPIEIRTSRGAARAASKARASGDWGRIVAEGRAARQAVDKGRWRIGSLALLVEKRYGARSLQAFADEIGESYSTVRRYRWVVKRYDPTVRFRFAGLSFSHFQAVAGLPDGVAWLERAERGCWSVDRLIKQTRSLGASGGNGSAPRPDLARLRTSIEGAARSIAQLSSLDDAAIARAEDEWLTVALSDLAAELERLRKRLGPSKNGSGTNRNGKRGRNVRLGTYPPVRH
jgi:hypothetical protein